MSNKHYDSFDPGSGPVDADDTDDVFVPASICVNVIPDNRGMMLTIGSSID